jgi:hypothetical protein
LSDDASRDFDRGARDDLILEADALFGSAVRRMLSRISTSGLRIDAMPSSLKGVSLGARTAPGEAQDAPPAAFPQAALPVDACAPPIPAHDPARCFEAKDDAFSPQPTGGMMLRSWRRRRTKNGDAGIRGVRKTLQCGRRNR